VVVLGSTVFFPGEKMIFRGQTSYSYYPDKFWGLGNDSPESAKESYTLKQFFFNPQLLIKFYQKLYAGVTIEMQDVRDFTYRTGNLFDGQDIIGRKGGLTAGAGVLFTFDTRNNAYSPSAGSFAEINLTRFAPAMGSDFDFTNYTLDLRKFFSVGRNRVLGLQSFTRFNQGHTPIRYLSMLGGSEMMRGYYKGRFADRNLIAFQSEIRQYLFWRLGVAAFVSAGQVGRVLNDFGLNDFHLGGGGGLRLMLQEKEKLNLRVDVGFGKNSSGVYVIMKEAF
jgi:outer membrane protein assembly factor BamA